MGGNNYAQNRGAVATDITIKQKSVLRCVSARVAYVEGICSIALGNTAFANSDIRFAFGTDGTELPKSSRPSSLAESNNKFVIDKDGKVGIGTNSPGQKLDISGGNILINEVSWGTASQFEFKPSFYTYSGSNGDYDSGDIGKITFTNRDADKRTYITGRVFSGYHIPSIKFIGKAAYNGSAIDIMTLRGQRGNVGIGTDNPIFKAIVC